MQSVPQVRVSAYLAVVEFMRRSGGLSSRHVDDGLLAAIADRNPEALVPIYLAHAFLDRSARATGLAELGYVVGRGMRVESLGAFGRSVVRSLSLLDALGKVRAKFGLYSSAERIWWSRRGEAVSIFHAYNVETGPGSRVARQVVLLLLRDLVRLAAGPGWQPAEVLTPTTASDAETMRAVFPGARVRPSEFAGIVFPARFLSLPLDRSRQAGMRGGGTDDIPFEASAPAADFPGSIKQVISAQMKLGRCGLERTADLVGMHPRTLQRRLAEAELEYTELLAEVRFEEALRLLYDTRIRMVDIAGELGYTDSANFTRAFRQWTGVSPSHYRRLRQDDRVAK